MQSDPCDMPCHVIYRDVKHSPGVMVRWDDILHSSTHSPVTLNSLIEDAENKDHFSLLDSGFAHLWLCLQAA